MSSVDQFPARLRECRQRAGMTQSEVARSVHYAHAVSVSQWELGRYAPPTGTIRRLAALFGVDAAWLGGWDPSEGGSSDSTNGNVSIPGGSL